MAKSKIKQGSFKTVKVTCNERHEVARYRKPRAETGHQTHKLLLVPERIGRLITEPVLIDKEGDLLIPETGTEIQCGNEDCTLNIGRISMIKGTPALELNKSNLAKVKG